MVYAMKASKALKRLNEVLKDAVEEVCRYVLGAIDRIFCVGSFRSVRGCGGRGCFCTYWRVMDRIVFGGSSRSSLLDFGGCDYYVYGVLQLGLQLPLASPIVLFLA